MKLLYSPADASDAQVIFSQAKSLIEHYEDFASVDREKVLAWTEQKIQRNIGQYCRVLIQDTPCAWYRLTEDGELDDLYVLPEFQNRGIGSEIINKCIQESKNDLYLYVFTENIRAIALYERFGFTTVRAVSNTRKIMARGG